MSTNRITREERQRMEKQHYIDYIRMVTTGFRLVSDLSDEQIGKFVDEALEQIQPYIDTSVFITVPFSKCIDLTGFDHDSITHVYRVEGFTGDTTTGVTTSDSDPLYVQTWSVFTTGGTMYNLQNYVMNYLSYNTLLQMRNTLSTDLDFKEDKNGNRLYINAAYSDMQMVTIEYIPTYHTVEQVTSSYWRLQLKKLSLALVKIALGRIRTRFGHAGDIITQDGDKILEEGTTEYKEVMQHLTENSMMFIPVD